MEIPSGTPRASRSSWFQPFKTYWSALSPCCSPPFTRSSSTPVVDHDSITLSHFSDRLGNGPARLVTAPALFPRSSHLPDPLHSWSTSIRELPLTSITAHPQPPDIINAGNLYVPTWQLGIYKPLPPTSICSFLLSPHPSHRSVRDESDHEGLASTLRCGAVYRSPRPFEAASTLLNGTIFDTAFGQQTFFSSFDQLQSWSMKKNCSCCENASAPLLNVVGL